MVTGERFLVAVALATAIVLSGCIVEAPRPTLEIRNESGDTLEIFRLLGGEGPADDVIYERGTRRFILTGECESGGLVARTEHGVELDRIEDEICDGDLWVVPPPEGGS